MAALTRAQVLKECRTIITAPKPKPPVEEKKPEVGAHEWRCPDCGNRFGYDDGLRYLTANKDCPCNTMPRLIRLMRKAMGKKEQA